MSARGFSDVDRNKNRTKQPTIPDSEPTQRRGKADPVRGNDLVGLF